MSVTRLKNLIHELDAFLDELADHSTLENQLELLRQTQVLILLRIRYIQYTAHGAQIPPPYF